MCRSKSVLRIEFSFEFLIQLNIHQALCSPTSDWTRGLRRPILVNIGHNLRRQCFFRPKAFKLSFGIHPRTEFIIHFRVPLDFGCLYFRRKYISNVLKRALSSLYLGQRYLTFYKHTWIYDSVFQHLIFLKFVHRTWQHQGLLTCNYVFGLLAPSSSW